MTDKATKLLMKFIAEEENYLDVCDKGDAGICAIHVLMFTYAILADCNRFGYGNRWCYHTYDEAKAALDAWNGEDGTEPTGWHRHPPSGRRVHDETGEIFIQL